MAQGKRTNAFWQQLKSEWQEGANSETLAKKYDLSAQAVRRKMALWDPTPMTENQGRWRKWVPAATQAIARLREERVVYADNLISPEILARLCDSLEIGMNLVASTRGCGAGYRTVRKWLERYPPIQELIDVAIRAFQHRNMTRIDRTADHDWHAAKWLLEVNEATREEVKPQAQEQKLTIEFAFKRDELAHEDSTLIDNVEYIKIEDDKVNVRDR